MRDHIISNLDHVFRKFMKPKKQTIVKNNEEKAMTYTLLYIA